MVAEVNSDWTLSAECVPAGKPATLRTFLLKFRPNQTKMEIRFTNNLDQPIFFLPVCKGMDVMLLSTLKFLVLSQPFFSCALLVKQ